MCPFCQLSDVVISGDFEWSCRACGRTYPTKAYKCRIESCWGYAENAYCPDHEPAKPKSPRLATLELVEVSKVDEVFASVDAANAAALANAEDEARATGKELFSLSRLEELYGESLTGREASLALHYYVRHPELRTLAAFVRHLRKHEVWE